MRILEEFWYGNIEPTEYDTIACKEYKEVLRLITAYAGPKLHLDRW